MLKLKKLKNDLFVAEKAEIFDEEKQISDKAPIEKQSVTI